MVSLLVRRDFVSQYKQTILGPIWFFISPLLTTFTFFILLSKIGNVHYEGVPPILFIFSGLILWNYFSETFIKISETFISNSQLFSKVYFPRSVVPFSILISGLYKFGIQFIVLFLMMIYYYSEGRNFQFNFHLILLPLFVALIAIYALSLGMIISSLTVKYRDLRFLVPFFAQLLMFFSSVIYDISFFSPKIKLMYHFNPFTDLIEGFRQALFSTSNFRFDFFIFHFLLAILLYLFSAKVFARKEKYFLDQV